MNPNNEKKAKEKEAMKEKHHDEDNLDESSHVHEEPHPE
jgi:hypothetical protein